MNHARVRENTTANKHIYNRIMPGQKVDKRRGDRMANRRQWMNRKVDMRKSFIQKFQLTIPRETTRQIIGRTLEGYMKQEFINNQALSHVSVGLIVEAIVAVPLVTIPL